MALTLVAEPNDLCLVQDDMKLHVTTDKFQTVLGEFSVIELEFTDEPEDNDYVEFVFNDGTVVRMTAKGTPDDTGEQFPKADGPPALAIYAALVVDDFKTNYELNSRFDISVNIGTAVVVFTARERTTDTNLASYSTNVPSTFTVTQTTTGVDPVFNENFEVGLDIYVEDGYRSGEYVKLPTVFAKPETTPEDSLPKAIYFNLSERVRRYVSEFDPEILASVDVLNILERVNIRYYYEYFEFYGTIPEPKKVYRGDVAYALFGALNFIDYTEITYWYTGWYYSSSIYPLTRFLSWQPDTRYVPKKQPCWISWLNNHDRDAHSGENYYLRCKITYTDNTTHSFDAATDADSDRWETLSFKCGYEQLGLEAINPAKVVKKWEVWLDHMTPWREAITTSVTFILIPDHALQRFFVYPNAFGCPESIRVIGRQTTNINVSRQSFWKHVGMSPGKFDRQRKTSVKSFNKTFAGSTGVIKDRDYLHQVIEFLTAENVFIYDAVNDRYIPVYVFNEQTEFEKDDDYVYGVSLEWAEAFDNKKFSAVLEQ